MRLRPHHIMCVRFLPEGDTGRGEEYARTEMRVRDVITRLPEEEVEVTEGPDELCAACPELSGGRCANVYGDEESVRKWDARIIQGLGISYGERLSSGVLSSLIRQKAPLAFCKDRCPWRSVCRISE